MPIYSIAGPNGAIYDIEGPEGVSDADLFAAVRKQMREERYAEEDKVMAERRATRQQTPEEETTVGGNVLEAAKGVIPGAVGLLETAGTGIASMFGEDTEQAARESIKNIAGIVKKPFEAAPGYEDSVGRNIGQGLGSLLAVAPLAFMGPAGVAGGIGVGLAAGAGEARESAEAKGATAEERATATGLGTIPGAFDTIIDMTLAAFPGGKAIGFIKRALISGGVEGATEAAQQVAQNAIAKGVYDPSQELIEGSGEQGAYGAGVGTIASLLLDMAIPGRRRGPSGANEKPLTPEAQGGEAPRLGAEGVFTPVSLPDGSVAMTREDLATYEQSKFDQQYAPQDTTPSIARETESGAQGELFQTDKDTALLKMAGIQGPQPQTADDFELAMQEAPRGEQQELDLQAPVERDTQTMDMVTDLEETQQIEDMVAQDEAAAKVKREEIDTRKARLKFESDLAETDARVKNAQEKGTEEKRLALLLPLIEAPDINIPKLFAKELKRNGLVPEGLEAILTPREKKLIQRAYDLRLAEAETEVEATPTDTEANNAELESAIPEKGARSEPVQMGLPGTAKPKGMQQPEAFSEEEIATQEEKPFDTVLTPEVLDKTGLPKQSGFYKQLLNMDMADPTQQPVVANIFGRVRENPNVKPTTKEAVETLAMQAFGGLAKQGEMFGPRGATLVGKPAKKETTSANKPADTGRVGTGASVGRAEASKGEPARPTTTVTQQPKAPNADGLGANGKPANDAGTRKSDKPVTVTPEVKGKPEAKAEPAKTEVKGKPEVKVEPKKTEPNRTKETRSGKGLPLGGNAYQMAKEQGEGDHAIRTLAADAYLNTAEDYSVKKAEAMLRDLNDGKDLGLKFGKDNSNGPGTGGKYAREFYASLNAKEKAAFNKDLQDFLYLEIKTKGYFESYNRSQAIAREEFDGDISSLAEGAKGISVSLHPEVVRMVKNNDLVGALKYIGNMGTGRIPMLAKKFATLLTNVDIGVMDFNNPSADMQKIAKATNTNLTDNSGVYLTNNQDIQVILLDINTGLDVWTLLHEASHAVTHATLQNKSHPLTKQLTQLFNDVKDSLGTAYGAERVSDFASEAHSNQVFRQELARINPKGEKITALRRFVHAVKNFLRSLIGMDTKSLNSALDSADYLLEAIVQGHGSGSVSGDSPVFTASLLNKGESAFKAIDQRIKSLPVFDNTTAAGILDFLRTAGPETIKKIVLRGLPLNALTEVASKEVPMAPTLAKLEKEWNGAVDINRNAIEDTWVNIKKWGRGNPEKLQALDTTVMESTLARVDPSKDRSKYVGKTDESGNKLDAAWDRLQPDWKKLGPDGQAIYNQMRDSYATLHQKLINQIMSRIDESVSGDVAKNLKKEILARLATKGKIEPYFPLAREGEYRISYDTKGPEGNIERYVEHYANAVTRDRAALTLEAGKTSAEIKALNIETFKGYNLKTYRDAPSSSFMNQMIRTMEANKVGNETIEEVMRAYQNALPESAFAQAFRNRKDIRGADTNSTQVFYDRSLSMSYQMASLEYAAKMYKLRDQINEHVTKTNRSDEARLLATELNSHIQTLVRPEVAGWSKALTSAAFGWTLGFNVSSAAVNMSQVPLVVMPYLGGKYGYGKTSAALGNATKLFFGSGLKRTATMTAPLSGKSTYQSSGAFSLDNYDFDAKGTAKEVKRLKELSALSVKYGLLDRSMINDLLESGPKSTVLDTINKYSGFIFHHGERMNRQVALIAAYNLELGRMAKEKKVDIDALTSANREAAAEEAVRLAELLNGGASAGSAPLLAKNSIGKVIFMYKRYGASMYYMMFKTAKEAMKSESPEVRDAAMRQILGIYVSAGLMAGVQGLPMVGMLTMIVNMFRDDDEDDAETSLRKYFGEGMYSGAANYLMGVNVASRIGLTDLLIADTGYKSQDGVLLSALAAAGGPVYGVGTRIGDGVKMIYDGEYQRGVEKILPAGFSNAMKSIRYATEGANTMRGDPIVGEMSYANAAGQFFGFAPADYTRQLEINANVKGIDRSVSEKRTKLLRGYYMAMRMGDTVAGNTIMEEIQKFSQRHPGAAITLDTLLRSMKQHMQTSATMYHGITLSKGMMPALMANIAEYEGDEDE